MSDRITAHYEGHLAKHYSWLFGGLTQGVAENLALFEELQLAPRGSKRALDVGAGTGFQSIALARLGFDVTAVDLSGALLAELATNAAGLPVRTVEDDILHYVNDAEGELDLIVCMGDTLPHLVSLADVERFLREAHRLLSSDGRLVLAFRDYSRELTGASRFIPVRADEDTIATCFLEYASDHLRVFDLLHHRTADGWRLEVSDYPKLRVAPAWVEAKLLEVGFTSVRSEARRMHTIVAGRGTLLPHER